MSIRSTKRSGFAALIVLACLTILISGCQSAGDINVTGAVTRSTLEPKTTASLPPTSQVIAAPAQSPALTINPPIVNGVVTIMLGDAMFTPATIWIPAGTVVEWQTVDHLSVHAVDGEDGTVWGHVVYWEPYRKTFDTPGTYNYFDDFEPIVKGTVIVY